MGEDGARGRKSEGTGAGRMGIFFQYCAIFCKRKSTVQRRGEGGAGMGERTVREAGSTTPPVSPSNTPTYFIL